MTVERANAILLGIIALLMMGLCIYAVVHLRLSAALAKTDNQLRSIATALHAFHDTNSSFPPVFDSNDMTKDGRLTMLHAVSFHVHLLPFVGQGETYQSFVPNGNGKSDSHVPAYLSEIDGTLTDGAAVQCFAANFRAFSTKGVATHPGNNMPALARIEPGRADLRTYLRGTSHQIIMATKLARCGKGGSHYAADPTSPYAAFFGQNAAYTTAHCFDPTATFQWAPRGDDCLTSPLMAQSYLPGPLPIAFADGYVRRLRGDIKPGLWNRLLSPSME